MQDEVNTKTVAISIQASKVTMQTLYKIARHITEETKQKQNMIKTKQQNKGTKKKKMTVKELSKKYDGLKTVDIDDDNIKGFEKYARKYNLEYALKKDAGKEPPTYVIFFKGKDTDMIERAFKDLINDSAKVKKPSLITKLHQFAEKALKKNKDKTRNKHQEQSL
ncbi:MAG: PcfB family protein [Peptoniphilaceae bacterium]